MNVRLGDVIDDYCIKCRRLTNHAVVSLVEDEVAKVRCRSCYHEHSYLREQAPPSRKDLKKAELEKAELEKAELEKAEMDGADTDVEGAEADMDGAETEQAGSSSGSAGTGETN